MTTPVTDAAPDDDIISVAESMLSNKQRRRPVVNQGSLVGQITCRQLLGALLDY
jgi:CBS domain-containing protein